MFLRSRAPPHAGLLVQGVRASFAEFAGGALAALVAERD
jgi:hypothetical protein